MNTAFTAPLHIERMVAGRTDDAAAAPTGRTLAARLWARIAQHAKPHALPGSDASTRRPEATKALKRFVGCAVVRSVVIGTSGGCGVYHTLHAAFAVAGHDPYQSLRLRVHCLVQARAARGGRRGRGNRISRCAAADKCVSGESDPGEGGCG